MSWSPQTIELSDTLPSISLCPQQIEAASRIYGRLKQWRLADAALARLGQDIPGFNPEACLLKAVAVNTLYGTQVLAIVRMAEHICQIMTGTTAATAGPEIVKQIASLPKNGDEKARRFTSFAAKFCHFFIDQERFPIYDEAARDVLKLHLGKRALAENKSDPYQAFCTNLARLRTAANIQGTGRNLDRYLWITGMYMKWLKLRGKEKQQMNVELRTLFAQPTKDDAATLDALLPSPLERAFEGET